MHRLVAAIIVDVDGEEGDFQSFAKTPFCAPLQSKIVSDQSSERE